MLRFESIAYPRNYLQKHFYDDGLTREEANEGHFWFLAYTWMDRWMDGWVNRILFWSVLLGLWMAVCRSPHKE